ncbi:MAG: cupin domain-containing protein [Bryobacteraceae bacterium]
MSGRLDKPGLCEQAMLLALGLGRGEDYPLAQLAEQGVEAARQEIARAEELAAELAFAPPPAAPPASLKDRLMARVAPHHEHGLGAIRKDEGVWRQSKASPGVSFKVLYRDNKANLVTQLVRMAPGAKFPAHLHGGDEQCLIIEGDLRHNGHVYTAGDFTWAEAETVDPELHTVDGNLLLIIGSPGTKFISQ